MKRANLLCRMHTYAQPLTEPDAITQCNDRMQQQIKRHVLGHVVDNTNSGYRQKHSPFTAPPHSNDCDTQNEDTPRRCLDLKHISCPRSDTSFVPDPYIDKKTAKSSIAARRTMFRNPTFEIRTSRSAPKTTVFQHFHWQMCFSPQRRVRHNSTSERPMPFATAACIFPI